MSAFFRSRRPRTAALTVALIGAIALVSLPATASASKVSVSKTTLKYSAQGREENNLNVSLLAGVYTVSDNGTNVVVRAGKGCVQVDATTATCTDTGLTNVSAVLGAFNDVATIDPTVPVSARLNGGGHDDTLTGGPAADTIIAGGGIDTINSLDGVVDKVNCGGGVDVVNADLTDELARNCP